MLDLQRLKGKKYLPYFGTVKRYTENHFKVTVLRSYRQKGIEDEEKKFTAKGEAENESKLDNSISRSKSKVFELAICNPWEYFVTLTLDKKKYDRYNLPKFIKDLSQAIRDIKKKYKTDIHYLLIPEKHQDGAWHLHGFMIGLPPEQMREFSKNDTLPNKIRLRLSEGKKVYTWTYYEKRFGFADIERIENAEAVSKYITKYITEDMRNTISELNAHIYYCSKGLRKADILLSDYQTREIECPDYENEYVKVKNVATQAEAMRYFE